VKPPPGWYWWEVFAAAGIMVLFAATLTGVDMAWNQLVYGDWHCAFAACRKLVQ
jgi:hypothetical protein